MERTASQETRGGKGRAHPATRTREKPLVVISSEFQSWGYAMTHDDALRIIEAEKKFWGNRLPKYLTLEQALRIVRAT